jgi:hypothetical protein
MTSPSSSGALEAVERILNRGGNADEVLRQVVDVLHSRTGGWVGIAFDSALRASAGGEMPENHQRHPIVRQGQTVAELRTSAEADPALCARVALLISPYCLP